MSSGTLECPLSPCCELEYPPALTVVYVPTHGHEILALSGSCPHGLGGIQTLAQIAARELRAILAEYDASLRRV